MGIETALLVGGILSTLVGAGATIYSASMAQPMPAPLTDTTDYDLMAKTQAEANAEADAQKARQDEARKREELRQQAMMGRDVLTSDNGAASPLGIRNVVLGSEEPKEVAP